MLDINSFILQSVCQKCGLDALDSDGDVIWLCMLCSEHREVNANISVAYRGCNSQPCFLSLSKIFYNTIIQYNNLFAFPCEIRLQEIYIHIFFFYDKMLSNFEICI